MYRLKFSVKQLLLFVAVSTLFLGGCAGNQAKPVAMQGNVVASTSLNPDVRGESRPVTVSIFYLTKADKFNEASFVQLYRSAEQTLGGSLLKTDKYQVTPGLNIKLKGKAPAGTQKVGIVAAFRDVQNATWRATVDLPRTCRLCFSAKISKPIIVRLNNLGVSASVE